MAENYGSLEGVLDANETLEGEIDSHDEMSGEIQFSGGVGGVKDVQVNNESVVDANKVAHIDLTPYAEKEDVYDKQTIDTALEGKADTDDIPTALSQLDNDDNYVQDADYVHTNNNFTDEDKAAIGGIPENITDLSDVEVSNIQNGQVLKWDATQEKFVNANESGGSGDVTDVKVNDTSVVDAQGVANIDLTGYAEKSDLGTASALDVAVSGDASTSQVVKGDDTRLTDARTASDVSSWAKASTKPDYTASEVGAIATTAKGTANGVAELDENGKVPSAQLPSYVDDVLEYASVSVFPATGESGKIYIALDTNKTYRWSGTTYIEISESLALGETDSTAYAGNKGKQNADNIAAIQGLIPSSATTSNKLATASDIPDISGKADKSEMSVSTSGDQTTIQLKNGTSATVLNAHQSITGKADKVTNATENNFAALDANGNLKDSGHKHSDYLTQHQDISGKADKVSGATDGHIAGLDANGNLTDSGLAATTIVHKADKVSGQVAGHLASLSGTGNLTDSGWNGAKDTTSVSGNPISIPNLKSNQLALNPIITLEPIQAGSGTPSPSNVRAISGYDKIEVLSCGKNILDLSKLGSYQVTASGTMRYGVPVYLKAGTYTFSKSGGSATLYLTNVTDNYSYVEIGSAQYPYTFSVNANSYVIFRTSGNTPSDWDIVNAQLEEGSSATTYEPCIKSTSISESLGQTVYGGTLDLRSGKFTVEFVKRVYDGSSDESWIKSTNAFYIAAHDLIKVFDYANSIKCDKLQLTSYFNIVDGSITNAIAGYGDSGGAYPGQNWFYIGIDGISDVTSLKTWLSNNPIEVVYELATPTEIQLTPHEISLLKDYAYVSTNGTNIALDYHNGELAALSDTAQVGETLNELEDKVSANDAGAQVNLMTYNTSTNKYVCPSDGYITLSNVGASVGDYIIISVYGANDNTICGLRCDTPIASMVTVQNLFVKRGMKCYIRAKSTGSFSALFTPLS